MSKPTLERRPSQEKVGDKMVHKLHLKTLDWTNVRQPYIAIQLLSRFALYNEEKEENKRKSAMA
eukprot:3954636-Amphidinium_carterae.1